MKRYRLRQGKLRWHPGGEWVKAEDVDLPLRIARAAQDLRLEASDATPCVDLGLRVTYRERLHKLVDEWIAAEAAEGKADA